MSSQIIEKLNTKSLIAEQDNSTVGLTHTPSDEGICLITTEDADNGEFHNPLLQRISSEHFEDEDSSYRDLLAEEMRREHEVAMLELEVARQELECAKYEHLLKCLDDQAKISAQLDRAGALINGVNEAVRRLQDIRHQTAAQL